MRKKWVENLKGNYRSTCFSNTVEGLETQKSASHRKQVAVYRAVVLTSLLYGSETWTCYRRHIKKLDQFHLRCLRRILDIRWEDRVTNQEVLCHAALPGIEALIMQSQL